MRENLRLRNFFERMIHPQDRVSGLANRATDDPKHRLPDCGGYSCN
jgi:hypothetical protein